MTSLFFHLHVLILVSATLCFFVTFFSGIFYLLSQRDLKVKRFTLPLSLPSLEVLDRVTVRYLVAGVVLLTIGNGFGVYLAHVYWKVKWLTNIKFVLSFVTWAWFVLLLGIRYYKGWRGRRFFLSIVIGFAAVLVTFMLSILWKNPWM